MAETSVITNYRRKNLCKITSGAISSIPKITHIAFGDGGVDDSGEPKTPLATQMALNSEIERYPIDGVTYPVDTTARYTVTIPKNDLPGEEISEAALVDAEGNLCAIKNMYVKKKDAGVSFAFTFDDEF